MADQRYYVFYSRNFVIYVDDEGRKLILAKLAIFHNDLVRMVWSKLSARDLTN